ncbi:alpha/beta fold hydrolase [Actinomadura atramentaria]|uniref:alpha/beta fold hydrolase n=1 Tax=Actinomadura atramentaria TaxID=1990 RepID=UPI000376D5E0|nr:alpha/beta fold hydrolase [Actinomadura atramentaria]
MLLHAFPLSSAMWLAQREGLADRFRVLTPDLPGFGGSRLVGGPPSLDAAADAVAELLDWHGIGRAVVGGVSLGAHTALALLRRRPDLVGGLVLASARAAADPDDVRAARLRQADALERTGDIRAVADDVLPRLVGRTTMTRQAFVYGRVRGLVQAAPPAAAAWALRALADRPDETPALAAADVPALVLHGAEDALTDERDARALAAALPAARLEVIAEAGQLSPVEQPARFDRAVAAFTAAHA